MISLRYITGIACKLADSALFSLTVFIGYGKNQKLDVFCSTSVEAD